MWVLIRKAPNLMLAEMWKALFEEEGVPTRILPEPPGTGEFATYGIYVPKAKEPVVLEALRKV